MYVRTYIPRVKTISISELRQRVADVIEDARATDEPTVVLQRSHRAAYIVNPDRYERDQAELSALRRAVFIREVREAEAEVASGAAQQFDDVEALLDELRA
jgi:prevent-host-death family protein